MENDLFLTDLLHNLELLDEDSLRVFADLTANETLAKHARKLARNIRARQNPLRFRRPGSEDLDSQE